MGRLREWVEPEFLLALVLVVGCLGLWLTGREVPAPMLVLTVAVVGHFLGYRRSAPPGEVEAIGAPYIPDEVEPSR